MFTSHFTHIFTASQEQKQNKIFGAVKNKISQNMKEDFQKDFTSNKLNGLPSYFYQHY